jgi:hypothetical protein
MRLSLKTALIALPLALLPLSAQASSRVVLDFGNVAFGYSDGYWDRDHHWHRWHHHRDWDHYRHEYREHAYDRRHDHDRDRGWHDNDRYWDHR